MSKYRIYELAKEFNTESKVIIDILARNNMEAKNHMSSVGDDAKTVITRTFAHKMTPSANNSAPSVQVPQQPVQPTPQMTNNVPQPRPFYNNGQNSGQNQSPRPFYNNNNNGQNSGQNQSPRPFYNNNNNGQNPGQNQNPRPVNNNNNGQNPGQNQSPRPFYNNNNQQNPGQNQSPRPFYNNNNQQNPGQNQSPRPFYNNNNGQNPGQNQSPRPFYNNNNQQNPGQNQSPRPGYNNGQNPGQNQSPRPAYNNSGTQQPSTQARPSVANKFAQSTNKPPANSGGGFRNQNSGNFNRRPQQNNNNNNRNNQFRPAPAPKVEIPRPKNIKLGESTPVKDLASKMSMQVGEVIKKLMMLGVMATINQDLDFDTASLVAEEFGVSVQELPPEEDPTEIVEIEDDPASLVLRPPVVTVMGHVDHGKTSLLDSIRQTHVTSQEAGGITQHIGAYKVTCQGKKIVFLDTPGHEAFTAMRARGAQVTDIAILVVAADDGVMPQTIEAINHAKSANVPIIVAINKMDRPGANPDRVKQQLSDHGLVAEDWGGDAIMVPVSAQQKTGIKELLETIVLVAEMQEIKANPNRHAFGTIIEAKLDKGRGPVATVLIQKGTLHIGDSIIAGVAYGKVRAMVNDRGEKVKKAGPSTPVEVLGLADVPQAGDVLVAVDEKIARAVAEKRIAKRRTDELMQSQKVSLDDLFKQIQDGNIKDLNIVIKADVQGSVEALRQSLLALNADNEEVRVNIVHAGVGAINESDVMLASAANALIIGFNVRPDANSRKAATAEKVDIRMYRIIYEALNDVKAAMTGMLAPTFKELVQGKVEIRQIFTINKVMIAGAYVLEGKVFKTSQVRVIRDGIVVHEGTLESLRRFKDDVKEVAAGYECGVTVDNFRDLKEGDILEAFIMEEIKPKG